ncbi:MAG: squalene/phytoene synthase family protein, partial [Rhodospirillaceae bacterium]
RDDASMAAGRHIGIAWALTGIIRAVLFHARENKLLLPKSLLSEKDLGGHDVIRRKNAAKIGEVVSDIASVARLHLDQARALHAEVDPRAVPALLVGVLSEQYLKGLAKRRYDVFDPRHVMQRPSILGLTWKALRGRYC